MSSYTFREIPSIFYSSETEAPIERCLLCERELKDCTYLIEKAYSNYPELNTSDLIWEYAICQECTESLKSEYSEESRRAIDEYFITHADFSLQQKLIEEGSQNIEQWLSKCILSGKPRSETRQYQIYGYFLGDLMLFDNTPFMIADDAIDEIVKLVSNETLGFMNDFRDKHFPPPEDLSPLFPEKDFVLL